MDGLVLKDIPHEIISAFILARGAKASSVWETYSVENVLEIDQEDLDFTVAELSFKELFLPFLSCGRVVNVRTVLARASGTRAVSLLVRAPRKAIFSNDLHEGDLVDFIRSENMGNQIDLRWYARNFKTMKNFAEWSIWSGLPEPMEAGSMDLLITRHEYDIVKIRFEIEEMLRGGGFESASRPEIVPISVVDVLRKIAPQYD